ncbi:hotdog domain-containing protein [Novosphingobium bradum]|uniref:Hotdog domain-containing protein n=1 Tax=Novosphingobium bradum TaxID=1737444 RepID=A0ABV7IM75_9SPHN
MSVPAGYVPYGGNSPFVRHAAQFHRREADGRRWVGCRIGVEQANSEGYAHGGFLAAFADFALADTVMGITLSLTIDYIRPARLGDWIEAEIIERKRSASLVFADAMVCSGRCDLVRISGVFRPFVKRGPA